MTLDKYQDDKTYLVRLSGKTIKKIRKYGEFGQSYDKLINSLADSYRLVLKMKSKEKENKWNKWLEKNRV